MYITLLLALLFIVSAKAETWETTQFKVLQGVSPDDITLLDVLEYQEGGSWVSNKIAVLTSKTVDDVFTRQVEDYLHRIAQRYEEMGFRFPSTDDQIDSRIIVYLYNYDDGESLAKSGCTDPKGKKRHCYIKLDSSRLFSDITTGDGVVSQHIPTATYENLAHELFHSVQRAYPVFAVHEHLGDWIVEGTAQAMGVAMLDEEQKKEMENKRRIQFYGVRPYSTPLRVADDNKKRKNEGYHSSSLWTYLGEHISSHGNPEVKETSPDFRYLHALFNTNIVGKTNENKELAWLDSFLDSKESKINKKLAYIYPQFITTFTYFAALEKPYRFVPTEGFEGVDTWHKCLFSMDCAVHNSEKILKKEPCQEVYLDSNTPKISLSETFNKVSSRCFEVFYQGSPSTDIFVTLVSKDINVVNSIRALGMQKEYTVNSLNAGGSGKSIEVFTSEDVTNSNTGKIEGAYWILKAVDFSNRESVILVMSNIAKDVKKTLFSPKVDLVFRVTAESGKVGLSNTQASEGR